MDPIKYLACKLSLPSHVQFTATIKLGGSGCFPYEYVVKIPHDPSVTFDELPGWWYYFDETTQTHTYTMRNSAP